MAIKTYPGALVRLPVPGDPWPVAIAFPGERPKPAFVDHVREGGRIQTYAARRCPDLDPGAHVVHVYADSLMLEFLVVVA